MSSDSYVLRIIFTGDKSPLWLKGGNGDFEEYPLSVFTEDGYGDTAKLLRCWIADYLSAQKRGGDLSSLHHDGFSIAVRLKREVDKSVDVEYKVPGGVQYTVTNKYLLPLYMDSVFIQEENYVSVSFLCPAYHRLVNKQPLNPENYLIGDLELNLQLWASSWRLSLIYFLQRKGRVQAFTLRQGLGNGNTQVSKSMLHKILNELVTVDVVDKIETGYKSYETATGDVESQKQAHQVIVQPASFSLKESENAFFMCRLADLTLKAINRFPHFQKRLLTPRSSQDYNVFPEVVVLEEFLKVVARPRTATILKLIHKHEKVRHRDLLQISSKRSLSIIVNELQGFEIIKKHVVHGEKAVSYTIGRYGSICLDYYTAFEALECPSFIVF